MSPHPSTSAPVAQQEIDKDTVTMFEEAFKQQPQNEEYGAQTFMANVRAANWKSAQQVRTPLTRA